MKHLLLLCTVLFFISCGSNSGSRATLDKEFERAHKSETEFTETIFLDYQLRISEEQTYILTERHIKDGTFIETEEGDFIYKIPSVGVANVDFYFKNGILTSIVLILKGCDFPEDMVVLADNYVGEIISKYKFKKFEEDGLYIYIKDNIIISVGLDEDFDNEVSILFEAKIPKGKTLNNSQSLPTNY